MTMHLNIVLSLTAALGHTTVCSSFVNTFGIPRGLSGRPSTKTSSPLHASLWEADLAFDLEGDDDNQETEEEFLPHQEAKQIEIIKYKKFESAMDKALPELKEELKRHKEEWKRHKRAPCPFYSHLSKLSDSIDDPWVRAFHMDDELKRMESRYYSLVGDETPQLYFPLSEEFEYYNGTCVRPIPKAYELVLRQFYRYNFYREGAILTEELIARYEKYNPKFAASTKMMKFAMSAAINAGDLERTEYWLDRIEQKYELTVATSDYPGYYIYNPFLGGLKRMTNLSDKTIANRAMQALDKIGPRSPIATQCELFCSQNIYLEIMNYQARGYKGSEAFYRIEKVFRQLQENYEVSNRHEMLKPNIKALAPVFRAAMQCSRDDKVAKMASVLFDEYVELYKETGDPDFRPNRMICLSLNSIYARMTHRKRQVFHYTNRIENLVQWMEENGVDFNHPGDKTATFNLLLSNAESKMSKNPMVNPIQTRKLFEVVLKIFKKFHNGELNLPPNKSTYQIFLKACSKLPEGEARSKLAAKAFVLCRQNDCVSAEAVFKLHKADPEYAVSLLNSTDNLGFKREIFHF